MIGKKVLVRCRDAGVHVGTLEEIHGRSVRLTSANRIWRWNGANTCSEIANNGVDESSRIAETVPEIWLLEACEIIIMAASAAETITPRWSNA